MPRSRLHAVRSPRPWVPAAAGCALALVALWYFVVRDAPGRVSVEQAVLGFRAEDAGAASEGATGLPEPGVYVYETAGFEQIDALIGSRHDYPAETTITVLHDGCGLVLRWDFLDGRSTTREYCPSEKGLLMRRQSEIHRFFGSEDRRDYACDDGTVALPASAAPDAAWVGRCSTPKTTETARGVVVGRETLSVAGARVETVHVRLETELAGETRGTGANDLWLLVPGGLPVRQIVTNDNVTPSAVGDVRYEERYELTLSDLEPRR